jgi:hypothetical protein
VHVNDVTVPAYPAIAVAVSVEVFAEVAPGDAMVTAVAERVNVGSWITVTVAVLLSVA